MSIIICKINYFKIQSIFEYNMHSYILFVLKIIELKNISLHLIMENYHFYFNFYLFLEIIILKN